MNDQPSATSENASVDAARFEMMYRAIEVYRRHNHSKSLLQFEMFLLVASRAPITNGQIAKLLACSEAASSVALGNLGQGSTKFGKEMGKPPGLVSRADDPSHGSRTLITLTDKGSALALQMMAVLKFPLY